MTDIGAVCAMSTATTRGARFARQTGAGLGYIDSRVGQMYANMRKVAAVKTWPRKATATKMQKRDASAVKPA